MSLRVNAMPRPEDTTARLHQPDTHYDGSPRHICVVEFEQMSVMFDSPEDALAWLAWCADHVREALRAQGGCDENPCPLTLPAVTAHPRPVTA